MMSKAEQRRVNRLPKASEEEESRTEDIRRKLGSLGRREFSVVERWRKRMRMRRHHFREERLRVRKANTIRRAISRFNARAKRRHRRAAGKDVRLPGIL